MHGPISEYNFPCITYIDPLITGAKKYRIIWRDPKIKILMKSFFTTGRGAKTNIGPGDRGRVQRARAYSRVHEWTEPGTNAPFKRRAARLNRLPATGEVIPTGRPAARTPARPRALLQQR